MRAAPSKTSPSVLQMLEQGLSRLVESESEEGIIRALDAYLQALPELAFAHLSLQDGAGVPSQGGAAGIVGRTWLLGQRNHAQTLPRSLSPVSELASLDFAIRPGATGQLTVFGPWTPREAGDTATEGLDGLRILTLTLGAHLARVWRTGVTPIVEAPGIAVRKPIVEDSQASRLALEPLRFLETVDARLARTDLPGAWLLLIELAGAQDRSADRADEQVLAHCLQYLQERLPERVVGARSRPGELALFCEPPSADPASAAEGLDRAQQLVAACEAEFALRLGLSQAVWPEHGRTVGELLRHARAAGSGLRNPPPIPVEIRTKAAADVGPAVSGQAQGMRSALRRLVESGRLEREFRVVYQPRVSLKDMSLCGAEALLRWRSAEFGEVAPMVFLPILEDLGLTVAVGEWVLSEACRQVRRWADAGLPIKRLAVNLSASQLRAPETAVAVQRLMVETGLVAWCELEVDVTESTLMADRERVVEQLRSLAALGVRVAVDDFGLGHTALGWLASFPVSSIKVDRLFLAEVESNPNHAKLAHAMFELGRALNLRVSAEGVETASQLDFVRAGGCEEAQGFYIGRPLEAAHFLADASQLCH